MSDKWYYVLAGERKGPVSEAEIKDLFHQGKLNQQDYVWKKGFENWMKIQDVTEFSSEEDVAIPEPLDEISINLNTFDRNEKVFFIKTGADRGKKEVEYGPFSLVLLKKLYDERRINAKTFAFTKGMANWQPLGDLSGFEDLFEETPPAIKEEDRRAFKRKPLIARMFIQNNNQVYEGICRDVSIGGMQVLVDHFPGHAGDRISINVHPENSDHHFVASGEIVRALEGGLGFSFRFINLNEEAVQAINSYISQE